MLINVRDSLLLDSLNHSFVPKEAYLSDDGIDTRLYRLSAVGVSSLWSDNFTVQKFTSLGFHVIGSDATNQQFKVGLSKKN